MRISLKGPLSVVWIVFLTIVIGGVLNAAPPSWVLNKPADTLQYFYGVGIAGTLQDATKQARIDIASRIQATVSSEKICETIYVDKNGDEDLIEKCREESAAQAKQTLVNTEVRKSAEDDGEWYVLVEANRASLFKAQKESFDKRDDGLEREWKAFSKGSAFEKIKLSKSVEGLIGKAEQSLPLLSIYDQGFDDGSYKKRYQGYRDEIRSVFADIRVGIRTDYDSMPLVELIREALSQENIKLDDQKPKSLIHITTDTSDRRMLKSTRYPKFYGVKRKTSIKIKNKQGEVVSENLISTMAGSPRSYEEAIADTRLYKKRIEQKGIIDFLVGE